MIKIEVYPTYVWVRANDWDLWEGSWLKPEDLRQILERLGFDVQVEDHREEKGWTGESS